MSSVVWWADMPPNNGRRVRPLVLALALLFGSGLHGQTPSAIDTSTVGPQVGTTVPGFSGTDQFGKARTLESSSGENGTMLVFFRSADW